MKSSSTKPSDPNSAIVNKKGDDDDHHKVIDDDDKMDETTTNDEGVLRSGKTNDMKTDNCEKEENVSMRKSDDDNTVKVSVL